MSKNIFALLGEDDSQDTIQLPIGRGISTDEKKTILYVPKKFQRFHRNDKVTPKAEHKGDPLLLSMEEFPSIGTKLTKEQEKTIIDGNKQKIEKKIDKKHVEKLDMRSSSFATMADKEKVANSLKCTKGCRMVTDPYINPKEGVPQQFGVCTRVVCTFAHSEEELQLPVCGFDGNCRFMSGKRDHRTGKIIPGTQCRFHHSGETVDEYYERSKVARTVLPLTNEHSRKPQVPLFKSTPIKSTPIKSTDSHVKHTESTHTESTTAYVIRVPTKELAAVAIKAAIERGQYNLQVLVDGL